MPDTRNSLALKLIKELKEYGFNCRVHDPFDHNKIHGGEDINLDNFDDLNDLSVAIIVVAHDFYRSRLQQILNKCNSPNIVMDIPSLFIDEYKHHEKLIYWSL